MVYEWKDGSRIKADPQKIGCELEQIKERNANTIVQVAKKNKSSELHKCFEWDNTKAAEEYRLDQARLVLRSITVIMEVDNDGEKESVKIRAYESVNLPSIDGEKQLMTYVPIKQALSTPDLRNQVISGLKQTISEAETIAETYSKLVPTFKKVKEKLVDARMAV
jgi:hypothetical protein